MTELRKLYITDPVSGRTAELDAVSDTLPVIGRIHHKIHEQDAYHAQVYDGALAAGAALRISFKTPSGTKRAHMTFSFAAEGACHLTVAEGATWTTNTGTVVVPKNQFRGSTNESVLLEDKTATPTYTANGVLTGTTAVGAGTTLRNVYVFSVNKTTAKGSYDDEIVLKPDETYTISLTNDETTTKGAILHLDWYEHTDAA